MQIENIIISKLQPNDILEFEPILQQLIVDIKTGNPLKKRVGEIVGCMCGQKDSYGRIRNYLVAKDLDGKVFGCIAYVDPEFDLLNFFKLNKDEAMEMLNFFVKKEYQGNGIGKKLLNEVMGLAKKMKKNNIVWHSGPRFKPTWKFYNRLADEAGFIKGKYNGIDAGVWRKEIL